MHRCCSNSLRLQITNTLISEYKYEELINHLMTVDWVITLEADANWAVQYI